MQTTQRRFGWSSGGETNEHGGRITTLPPILAEAALTVAIRFRHHYRGYETPAKALAALRRRERGHTASQYADALAAAQALYDMTEDLTKRNARALGWPPADLVAVAELVSTILDAVRTSCPGFPLSAYRSALNWSYYWIVLR